MDHVVGVEEVPVEEVLVEGCVGEGMSLGADLANPASAQVARVEGEHIQDQEEQMFDREGN